MEISEWRDGGKEFKRGYEQGMVMSVLMGRWGKLHESGLTVHQLNKPHTADKDDERSNDDVGGAIGVLFLDAFSLPPCMTAYEQANCINARVCVKVCPSVCVCVSICVCVCVSICVCVNLSSCPSVHMVVGLSHVPLVLTTESGKSCSEELNVPSSWTQKMAFQQLCVRVRLGVRACVLMIKVPQCRVFQYCR